VIDAIERIEIAARSAWVQEMSIRHGTAHCYLNNWLFKSDFNYAEQLDKSRKQLPQSIEAFVIHYRNAYWDPGLPPIWAMTEMIPLGILRAWIAASKSEVKMNVARSLGMPSALVKSPLSVLGLRAWRLSSPPCRSSSRKIWVARLTGTSNSFGSERVAGSKPQYFSRGLRDDRAG
jgi:abortive infection bacteriophage resistance protein